MSSPKPASTTYPGWQLWSLVPGPLGEATACLWPTEHPPCAVPLLPSTQASLNTAWPRFPSLQTGQCSENEAIWLCMMVWLFPIKALLSILGGVARLWAVTSDQCTAVLKILYHSSSLHLICLCCFFPSSSARVTLGARRAPSLNLL